MDAGVSARLLDWRGRCPYKSRDGLRLCIRGEKRSSTTMALKRDVDAHQTRWEAGSSPEPGSLARLSTLVCNSPETEWKRPESGTRVIATRRQQDEAGHVLARVDAGETSGTVEVIEMIVLV